MPWIVGIIIAVLKKNAAKIAQSVIGKFLGRSTGEKAGKAINNVTIPWKWIIGILAGVATVVVFGAWMYMTGAASEREYWAELNLKEQLRQTEVNRRSLAEAHRTVEKLRAQTADRDKLIKDLTDEALAAPTAGDACITPDGSMRLNRLRRP